MSFCNAPWVNISIDPNGDVLPCCRINKQVFKPDNLKNYTLKEAWNGSALQNLREKFTELEKPEECLDCYKIEESGLKSYREIINERNDKVDLNLETEPPIYYDLKTTNVCNLKCRMCSSFNSSIIAKEQKEDNTWWTTEKLMTKENGATFSSWLKIGKELAIAGGEPFVNPETKRIIESAPKHMCFHINTNGMFYQQKLVDEMLKFERVFISISVDDLYERLEYARSNSKWKLIKENVLKFAQLEKDNDNLDVHIYCTVNNYNIWYLEEFFDYFKSINVKVNYQALTRPKELNISCLSSKVKTKIYDKYKNTKHKEIKSLMNYVCTQHPDLSKQFKEFNDTKDLIRKEKFEDVFPEWAKVIYG